MLRMCRLLIVVLLALPGPALAAACRLVPVSGAAAQLPEAAAIDAARLDLAILMQVNYARCRAGVAALGPAPSLRQVAMAQGRWMAIRQRLTHNGGPPGLTSLRARLAASRIEYRTGGENIATVSAYRIDNRRIRLGPGACDFRDMNGHAIPRQSYASLAAEVVANWMASPGHRRNILNPAFRWSGTGFGFDRRGNFCGTFYLSQMFAG